MCVCMCVFVCVCVCVPTPEAINKLWRDMDPIDWLNKFYSRYM